MMKHVPAPCLLSVFAAASLVCFTVALLVSGIVHVWAAVVSGFFQSIMIPTIFALRIQGLGPSTKGASLLVMAIIGGSVFPAIMGRISDVTNIQTAFIVPFSCYLCILYFALSGYKPGGAS